MELQMAQKYHGNFNLLTAISIYLRHFQFYSHGNFNEYQEILHNDDNNNNYKP